MSDTTTHPGQEIVWGVSVGSKADQPDSPPFELHSVHPPIYLSMWDLSIGSSSNWAFPYRVKVGDGRVNMTRKQVEKVIEDYMRLMKRSDEEVG